GTGFEESRPDRQNFRPASRAASASALMRPWKRKPERSNATDSTPAASARSATALPTAAAAARFLVPFRPSATDFCNVEAAATTLVPEASNTCAYRCWPVRCTDRRATASLRMCERVDLARRRRLSFLFIVISPGSGSTCMSVSESPCSFEECGHGWPLSSRRESVLTHLSLLGFLHRDLLAGIADALALVWLGRTEAADLGGHLADALLVVALDQDFGLRRRLDADAFGRIKHHRMGKPEA